jgi:hypothetical protein
MLNYAVLLVASTALAAEPASVPKEAVAEMKYRVGKWESTGFIDGVQQAKPGSETTKWCPGKYSIRIPYGGQTYAVTGKSQR